MARILTPRLTSGENWRALPGSRRCRQTGASTPRQYRTPALPCTTSLALSCYLFVRELSSRPARGWRLIDGDAGDS